MVIERAAYRHERYPTHQEWRAQNHRDRQSISGRRPIDRAQETRTHVRLLCSSRLTVLTKSFSYVSPRTRAQKTLELLYLGCKEKLPWQEERAEHGEGAGVRTDAKVQITEDIREWDYGDYEGITSPQIRKLRKKQGIGGPDGAWDIWKDGCPGGECVLPVDEI